MCVWGGEGASGGGGGGANMAQIIPGTSNCPHEIFNFDEMQLGLSDRIISRTGGQTVI